MPSGTLWSTSRDIHKVVEIWKETSTEMCNTELAQIHNKTSPSLHTLFSNRNESNSLDHTLISALNPHQCSLTSLLAEKRNKSLQCKSVQNMKIGSLGQWQYGTKTNNVRHIGSFSLSRNFYFIPNILTSAVCILGNLLIRHLNMHLQKMICFCLNSNPDSFALQ